MGEIGHNLIAKISGAGNNEELEHIIADIIGIADYSCCRIISKDEVKRLDAGIWSFIKLDGYYFLAITSDCLNSDIKRNIVKILMLIKMKVENIRLNIKKEYYKRYDVLTGLKSIDFFRTSIRASFDEHKGDLQALVLININRFKVINDSYGYDVGNNLLAHTAEQISLLLGDKDVVLARTYGDEFALFMPDVESREFVVSLICGIRDIIEIPICIEEYLIHVKLNIGIAFSDSLLEGDDSDTLMRYANIAIGAAKDNPFEKMHVFDKEVMEKIRRDLYLDTEIDKAIYMNSFHLVYQPIISTDNITLIGMEALIRWNHKEEGMIPPSDFIPLAEKTGQIYDIEKFVLRSACEFMGKCYAKAKVLGINHVAYASVNISAQQIVLPGFVDFILDMLKKNDLPTEFIRLEITETAIMKCPDEAISILDQLAGLGIKTSIDDFGTGYSSLAYLHDLKVDTLKIDGSFINRLSDTKETKTIVESILRLAKKLGMHVIAEGVEKVNQIMILKELGGVSLQGYYFSKPLEANVAEKYFCESLIGNPFIPDLPSDYSKHKNLE